MRMKRICAYFTNSNGRSAIMVAVATSLFAISVTAQEYQEGVHYERVPIPQQIDGDMIEVVEIFSWGCIHCFRLEPSIKKWRTRIPEDVTFRRIHATFGLGWDALAKAFYTAESLGVIDKVSNPIFRAIHESGLDMTQEERLARVFENIARVDSNTFISTYRSFTMQRQMNEGVARMRIFGVMGVPSLVVDGRFLVSISNDVGSGQLLPIVDFLVDKVRNEREASETGDP